MTNQSLPNPAITRKNLKNMRAQWELFEGDLSFQFRRPGSVAGTFEVEGQWAPSVHEALTSLTDEDRNGAIKLSAKIEFSGREQWIELSDAVWDSISEHTDKFWSDFKEVVLRRHVFLMQGVKLVGFQEPHEDC